jgi:multicomponent Na+:H+ antiporter subunit C
VTLILSLAIAALFGCGAYLMLKHDLLRLAIGTILISNGANLFLVSMALTRGAAPIYPLPRDGAVADPVVQALALTAIVITFGVSAILLGLMYRVYLAHRSIDLDDLARAEVEDQAVLEQREEGL